MNEVSRAEAVELLRWIVDNPDAVRGFRALNDAAYGPFPFLMTWKGVEAEVSVAVGGGVVIGIDFVRVGDRFANYTHWQECPLDGLRLSETAVLASVLDGAASRGLSGL